MKKSEKSFNNGTMTKAAFFGMIRSALRRQSIYWKPIAQAKINARKEYKGANKRQKWGYECNICKNNFKSNEVVVDHIIPAGALKDFSDLENFIKNLFCETDNLQVLCNDCHDKKTRTERKLKTNK